MIVKRGKRTGRERKKKVKAARTMALVLMLFLSFCFPACTFAANGIMAGVGKIGPLLKKEISPGQSKPLPENETVTKVIVVIDADYLQPLAADLLQELKANVERLGGRVGNHAFNNVQVWIPRGKIKELALWSRIKLIKKPTKPKIHDVMSASLRDFGAGDWQAGGFTGRGVKVGIIDAGFSGYTALLGTALPATVTIKQNGDSFSSSKHGTACAEIVHDLAPDAGLFLVNVDDIEVDFVNAVDWLQSKGVQVISSSIGINLKIFCKFIYETMRENNFTSSTLIDYIPRVEQQWNSTISNIVAHGVVWSQAAGNDARKQWRGPFIDGDQDGYLNFSPLDNCNKIDTSGYADEEVYVLLLWDGEAEHYNDYDLTIVDQYGNEIDKSWLDQARIHLGIEACKFTVQAGREYYLKVNEYNGAVHYDFGENLVLLLGHEQFPTLEYADAYGTVTLNCPAANPDVITAGAVSLTSSSPEAVIEDYSSQGPADGIIKPDLVAPVGVRTASYFQPFYGTSAAAPHVAGVCALVRQRYPDFTPLEVKQYLEANALDLGSAGKDNVYGSGLVRLPADFACSRENPGGCDSFVGCNGIDAFWYAGTCALEPRREVLYYNREIAAAPVCLGGDAADGLISAGDGLALEVDFPRSEETRNYALIAFPGGDAYFIRGDNHENFLTTEFTPVENGNYFAAEDICSLIPGYQGTWEIYFLSVPAEAADFKTLEALSAYLGSDEGQYVFGQYRVEFDCR